MSSDSQSTSKRTAPKRVRTEAQLQRKRELDRKTSRKLRLKNKDRMDKIENSLAKLQDDVSNLSRVLQGRRSSEPQGNYTRMWASASSRASDCSFPAPTTEKTPSDRDYSECSPGSIGLRRVSTDQLNREMTMNSDLERTGAEDGKPPAFDTSPWPGPLIPPDQLPPHLADSAAHIQELGRFEYKIFSALSRVHTALLQGPISKPRPPRSPSVANLLLLSTDGNPVAEILQDVFLERSHSRLADLVATYFLVYRLLRWRLHPDSECYNDIPEWHRPSRLQESVPHPIFIDFLIWPALRDALVSSHAAAFKSEFRTDLGHFITVDWPSTKDLFVKDNVQGLRLHPDFEGHIMNLDNWKMRPPWAERYPQFVTFVNVTEDG